MKYHNKNSVEQCKNIRDIRFEIDNIDYAIIELLSIRFQYVKAASKFKHNQADVEANAKFVSMLEQRKQWADSLGLNGEIIRELYANLVNYFIEEELNQFQKNRS